MIRRTRISAALAGLAAILILVGGCDRGPTAVDLRPNGGLRVGGVATALIAPSSYRSAVYSRTIGPAGGVLSFGVGSIAFPSGAVAVPTLITATVNGSTIGATFGPHGLQFPPSARPKLSFYISDGFHFVDTTGASIVYVDAGNVVLEILGTTFTPGGHTAEAPISHFSKFIFGAN